jgi:zinc protease
MEVIMMSRLAASSAQFLQPLLRLVIPLPLILVLPQFSSVAVYQEEAHVPLLAEGGGVMVPSSAEEPWQVVYQSDFSTDPGWTTNAPQNFYWNEAGGNYYFKRQNGSEQYSYRAITYDPGLAYRLEFDACLTRCDWAADLFLSLIDPDMHIASATTWQVSYHNVDQGKTASLIYYDSGGGIYHPGGAQPAPFELNTWYHTVAVYDPAAGTLSLQVTKVSDGSPVGGQELTGVGSFAGVDRLSISAVGHTYAPGAIAEGYIDNLVLKKYSPAAQNIIYQTDFSTDPAWITDQPSNYYWNQTALSYHAKVENNAPAYSPNRYFYTPVTWTGDSSELQWDIKMTRAEWSAGVSFGLFDETIGFAGFNGGQGVCLEFANPDAGRLIWLYICGGGGLASASSPGGTYSVNTLYTCKISYDSSTAEVSVELVVHDTGAPVWSKTLAVPGGFTQPLTKLGGSRSGFGETGGGYSGVNRWGVSEAEIDNVVLKRAGVGPVAPVVTQFAINSGAATTQSRTVTLNNTSENNPTHYMASESSAFTGAAWQTYSATPQFTLSAGDGQKTVYFKTKNAVGESNVVSDAITLQQAAAIYKLSAFLPARACYSADVSPDGNVIYASVSLGSWDEGVRLYDARTYELIRDIHSLPNVPKYILASADGIHLYATAYYEGTVVKVRVADAAVVKSISVGPWPVGMVFDSVKRYLYVMVNCPYSGAVGSISIIDTSTDTVVGTIGPIVNAGDMLAISPDDKFLYALGSGAQTLYKMSIAERSVVASVTGVQIGGISVSPNGALLYVGDRAAGAVRVFQTSSMTETTPIPIADVHGFWVAPSGDRALAVCLAPGSSELLIRVVGLPRGEVLQTLSQTLETPDALSSYPLVDPVFWSRTTGEALIPIFREYGGVIVISPAGEAGQVVYETAFSSDPGWVTDQAANYYWNQAAGTYHAKVENNAPGYRPNRYFYKAVTWTGDSLEVEWDVEITRMDWSGGVCLGLFDEDLALGGFEGGQGVQLVFGHPDEGLVMAFYATGATGLAQVDSKAGPRYSTNVWYTCKISYNDDAGEVSVEVKDRSSGSSVWSKSLSVPGRFSRPLVRLGGSWSGFGETAGGYAGVNRWAVAEAEIDNVVLKRAGVGPVAPVVTQFAINGGAATTQSRTVTLNNTAENSPTYYMASENAQFSGVSWQTYSTAPQFLLSAGDGQKTVYFKTENEVGESNVVSDTIQLITSVPQGPEITTTALPNGVEGRPYNEVLQVSGGTPPHTWSIVGGSLPDGLTLDPSTGIISGTPTSPGVGTLTFTVRVTDNQSAGDTIYVFGGQHDAYVVLSSVEKYDPAADVWTFVSPMNEPRSCPGFCTDEQGRVYVIAGGTTETVLQTVERYDPGTDAWEYLSPLPIAAGGPAAFALNGEIYAVGGWLPGYTNRCFIYSPDTDTWREGPSVYETFGHAGPVVSLSGVPYLIGGHLDTPSWSIRSAVSMLVREGADRVWKPSTPLQRRRQGVGGTLGLDGLIYAIGGDQMPGSSGHDTTETVERFSEATKAWEYVQSMPAKRAFGGAVTDSSGRIWLVGGTDWSSSNFLDSVLRYDPGTDSWTTMTSHLNAGRGGHGIAIIRGKRQTDEQELSITILPQGPWRVVYSSDFSTDPKWTTDDPSNLSWDSATETFHGWQSNADGTHAYTPIEPTSGSSFRLEFDVRINSIKWSAGLTFGLFDSRLMYNAGAVIEYGYFDVGYTIALNAGNPSGPPDWNVTNWETGVWYRNVIEYDAESKVITLEVRRRDDDALICQLSLSGISSFPPGMSFLGTSRLHMAGYNDAAVDFNLDNLVLEEFYQPPKREVEILPLAGPLLRISWDTEVGKEYQLWATSDLFSGEWIPVGPRMGGTGGKLYVDDYVEGLGNRFYRVETILPVAKSPDYAVVVSQGTAATDGWDDVVTALVSKYTAPVLSYSGSPFPTAVRDELAALRPKYVCFVAQPAEVTDAFVTNVHELTRQLDDDPFGDCIWGIITGAKPEDAMRLASAPPSLEIQAGLLKAAGYYLEWLPSGVFHSEGDSGTMWIKELGGEIEERTDGPLDDTESLVTGLNSGLYQLFVTSGHASEYNYQLHWPDPEDEGFFFSYDGQLYATDHNGDRHDINVPQPIIYWAPGNCLIGRIAGQYSMALGWLGSGKAVQFCGYVVPTWYGYMGWGLSDYFLKLQDRFSFAEAFFLTNQALLFDQLQETPGTDPEGLAYDKNAVVLYGDPAVKAVVSPCRDPLYNQTIEATAMPDPDHFRVVLTITMNEVAEVPRPVIAFLPFRIVPSETIVEQSEATAVEITDDMVLAQIWVQGKPAVSAGERIRVTFTCVRAS